MVSNKAVALSNKSFADEGVEAALQGLAHLSCESVQGELYGNSIIPFLGRPSVRSTHVCKATVARSRCSAAGFAAASRVGHYIGRARWWMVENLSTCSCCLLHHARLESIVHHLQVSNKLSRDMGPRFISTVYTNS